MKATRIGVSILIGLVVTTVTGLSVNSNIVGELPYARFVTEPLPGMSYYGYLLPWLKQVVYPGAAIYPGAAKQVIWQNFAVDMLFWAVLAYMVLAVFKLPVRPTARKAKARKSRAARRRRR